MESKMSDEKHQIGLQPYLSPVADRALSVGTAVGWIADVTIIGDTVLYGTAWYQKMPD